MPVIPQGLNTAIASGAAFGGGGAGPGTVYGPLHSALGIGIGEGGFFKEESTLFTGELPGGSVLGLKGFGDTGIFSKLFDAIFVGVDASAWGAWEGDESTGDSGGGDDNVPFSAIDGMGIAGFEGAEPVPHSDLGNLFPDPTPSVGTREQEMGII